MILKLNVCRAPMLCSGQNGKGREAFPGDAYNPSAWFGELLPLVLVPAENVTFKCIFEVTEEMYIRKQSMSFANCCKY